MSLYDVFPKLKTSKDWANFVTGLLIGVGLTTTVIFSLKSFFDLKLVSSTGTYTQKEVEESYISKEIVRANYIPMTELASRYVEREKILKEYMPVMDVQRNYIARDQCGNPDLSQYMLKADVERDYILKSDNQKKSPPPKPKPIAPINRFVQSYNSLILNEIGFKAEFIETSDILGYVDKYRLVLTIPGREKVIVRTPFTETFDVGPRRFTVRVSSVRPDGAQLSLVER